MYIYGEPQFPPDSIAGRQPPEDDLAESYDDDLERPSLSDSTYVVAHCETTGLRPQTDAVYDVALVRFDRGQPADRLCSFIFPEQSLPPAVRRSCSLSNFDVADAPTLDELMPKLRAFVDDDPIVAHDAEIAQAFLARISDRTQWLSVMNLAARSLNFGLSRDFSPRGLLKVADLEEHRSLLGVPPNRAECEAIMTGLVMREMLEEFEIDGWDSIDAVYRVGRRRAKRSFIFAGIYRGEIEDIPEPALRWILRDASKPPRQRCMHLDKDTLHAIEAHLRSYAKPLSRAALTPGANAAHP